MTNEIEKMYKLSNLEAINIAEYGSTYISQAVEIDSKLYPPLTAEKQIELIKWLGSRRHVDIDIHNIKGHTIYDISNDYDCITDEYKFMFDSNTFEDALAGLINQVWYYLTEEEKQQVKEILE